MARSRQLPLKRFTVRYTATAIVEAKNPREALEIADEAMTDLVLDDDLALTDIFAVELTDEKIHDFTQIDEEECEEDDPDSEDTDDEEDADTDEDSEDDE